MPHPRSIASADRALAGAVHKNADVFPNLPAFRRGHHTCISDVGMLSISFAVPSVSPFPHLIARLKASRRQNKIQIKIGIPMKISAATTISPSMVIV
jgi:hypothetical protein